MPTLPPFTAETTIGRQITSRFLVYVRRYDVVQQPNPANRVHQGIYPEQNTGMFLLRRAFRSNDEMSGDIVPLDQLRSLADVAPRFGEKAEPKFRNTTSLTYATEFWLNKYFDKELLFYALSEQ